SSSIKFQEMKTKSAEESSDEKASAKADDGFPAAMDLISYNDLLEKYLQSKMNKTQLTVSNIEDGSYLLKMNIDPFPPLTCLISKHDWVLTMQKVSSLVKMSSETTPAVNSCPPVDDVLETTVSVNETTPESKKSPLSPPSTSNTSSSQGEQRNRKSRRSLKVRFHRLGADQYKVVGVAESASPVKVAGEDVPTAQKHTPKKGHKKGKKSKRRSSESMGNEEVAYMIDESPVAELCSSNTSQMLNGSSSAGSASNGCHDSSLPEAICSLSKAFVAKAKSAAVVVTWPSSTETMSVQNGDSDSSIAPAQSLVLHHTWKHKHRRGDPVKVSSYVKRQSTPVSATISVKRRIPRMSPRIDTSEVESRMSERKYELRRRYSAPPSTRASDYPGDVPTSIAPPPSLGHEAIQIYNFCRSPSENTRSKCKARKMSDVSDEPLFAVKKEEEIAPSSDADIASPKKPNTNGTSPRAPQVVVKKEPIEENNPSLASESVPATNQKSVSRRGKSKKAGRPKKIRPRAGRRTGERVTADDQISSDDVASRITHNAAGDSDATEESRVPSVDEEVVERLILSGGGLKKKERSSRKRRSLNTDGIGVEVNPRRRRSSGDAYFGDDDDEDGRDGLYIDEGEARNETEPKDAPPEDVLMDQENQCDTDDKDECVLPTIRIEEADPLTEKEEHFEEEVEEEHEADPEDEHEAEPEVSDGSLRSESDLSRLSLDRTVTRPTEGTLEYRFKMWSDAYRRFRTNPYFIPEGEEAKAPQFVRYPPRSTSDVVVVQKDDKAFALLRGRFEVAIKLPVKGPNPTNWKEILVGDVVWVRWRKNEHWPATVYEITDAVPVKVTVFWVNDKTQSTVDYTQVDLFDMAFHIRFDCRRSDPKYVKAVVTALRYVGKMGFWESFLTRRVYEELVKEEGPTFCQHISAEEIKRIMSKQAKQAKLSKEMKKEDQIRLQKSEELLQALQASHFIFSYDDPPIVGSAYPLTNQVLEDYLGSACYASRNSEPLFEDGKSPFFGAAQKYDIDPEVMGSNEIYHPDYPENGILPPENVINVVTIGYGTGTMDEIDSSDNNHIQEVNEIANIVIDEVKPPTMEPFSEIDALRRAQPYRLPPKKRHRFKPFGVKPSKMKRPI
ncbi:hypothetical protein V3C99_017206, partial [Haemonchus contortus]|uniref:Ubiquitinyl hydrolase 1 n=1 Tax=Haemonchus contortus TaxID=6289 RepID=A0A7I4Z6Q2_HAECO